MLMPMCSLTDVIVLMLLEILYQNKKQLFYNSMVMSAALHLSQARFDTFAPPGGANVSNAWGTPFSRVVTRLELRHRGDGARAPTRAKISDDVLAMKIDVFWWRWVPMSNVWSHEETHTRCIDEPSGK